MNKRALAVYLCLIMIFVLLPTTSLAESVAMIIGNVYLEVGDYLVSNDTVVQDTQPDSGGYAYRANANTLILNNFSYDIGSGVNIFDAENPDSNFTLKLNGTNSVSTTGTSNALYVRGSITIPQESTGSLTATANGSGEAVYVEGSLSVNGGFLKGVKNGTSNNGLLYGVHVLNGSITVDGGRLEGVCSGNQANNSKSYGVYTKEGIITAKNNGSITGTAGTATTHSCGVQAGLESGGLSPDAGINADGGTITGYGGAAGQFSYGVYSSVNITAKDGGSITGTGGMATQYSYGVRAQKGVTADGGSIAGAGGAIENGSNSYGVYAGGEYYNNAEEVITVKNNGTITGTGSNLTDPDKKPADSIGVYAVYNIIAESGNIYGNGTKAINSCGVQARNNIVATGSNIVGVSKDGVYNYGVKAEVDITVDGGSVIEGTSGAADGLSYGVSAGLFDDNQTTGTGTITVNNGTINGVGGSVNGRDNYISCGVRAGSSINLTGGSITGSGSGNNSRGVYGHNSVTVSGGTVLAKSDATALNTVDYSSYATPCNITVSKSKTGSPTEKFVDAQLATYKYFRIGPPSALNPASSGGSSSSTVTVYNDPSRPNATIWLAGSGLDGSDQLITERNPQGSAYKAMLKLADSDDVFNTYNIYLRSGKKSTGQAMYLCFNMDATYAGHSFTLVHQKADGTYEYFYDTADYFGDLTFGPLYELSPFMLVKGKLAQTAYTSLTDAPKTGDNAQPLLWAGIMLVSLLGLGATAYSKKRKRV